jgi:hypothetical protein
MQTVLANLLKTQASLVALVDDKIDWDATPQGLGLPSVVLYVVSGVVGYTYAGPSSLIVNRVQIDSRGRTAAEALMVALAVSQKLSGYRGVFDGIRFQGCFEQSQRTRHDKQDAVEWFTDSRDYMIHWASA